MNMKLLDLQTGKYLELYKDWLDGGDRIHIFSDSKSELTNDKTSINEAIHIGFYADCSYIEACFLSEPPLPLKPICEKVGAVVYGGRYVLLKILDNVGNEICIGNIYKDVYKSSITYFILCYGFCNPHYDTNNRLEKPIDFAQRFYKITNFASYGWYFHKIWNNDYLETYANYIGFFQKDFTDRHPNDNIYYANIFEEFAKKEQGLENKFDELNKLIYA